MAASGTPPTSSVPTPGNASLAFDEGRAQPKASPLLPREDDKDKVTELLQPMPRWQYALLMVWFVFLIVVATTTLVANWPPPRDGDVAAQRDSVATDLRVLQTLRTRLPVAVGDTLIRQTLARDSAAVAVAPSCDLDRRLTLFIWLRPCATTERRFFVLVIFAGLLGGAVHGLTSLMNFRGNRRLFGSWSMWYLGMPIAAAAMATIFFLVIRGGLLPNKDAVDALNPYAVAAVGALAGLFTDMASAKLKEVLTVLFAVKDDRKEKLGNGKDETPPPAAATAVAPKTPLPAPAGATALTGTGNASLPGVGG